MVVGVVASVVVNWVLWPFVARHDLRRGISSMLFYCSVIYRSRSWRLGLSVRGLTRRQISCRSTCTTKQEMNPRKKTSRPRRGLKDGFGKASSG